MNVRIAFTHDSRRWQYLSSQRGTVQRAGGFPFETELHSYHTTGEVIELTAKDVCAKVNSGEFTNVEELDGEPHGCGCGCGEDATHSPEQSPERSGPALDSQPAPPKRPKKSAP
jgi:hypothetical protein